MKDIFERLRANEFKAFKGTSIQLKLPMPESLINEVIKASIDSDNIRDIQLSILPNNLLKVSVTATIKVIVKNVNITRDIFLQLGYQVEVGDRFYPFATLKEIDGGLGKVEQILIQVLSSNISKNLPPFIRLTDNVLSINVYQLLKEQEMGYAANYMDALSLSTSDDHKIWVRTEVNI